MHKPFQEHTTEIKTVQGQLANPWDKGLIAIVSKQSSYFDCTDAKLGLVGHKSVIGGAACSVKLNLS